MNTKMNDLNVEERYLYLDENVIVETWYKTYKDLVQYFSKSLQNRESDIFLLNSNDFVQMINNFFSVRETSIHHK